MSVGNVVLNWFDFLVAGALAIGIYRGRSRGISEELLEVLKWLTIVVIGGMLYRPAGQYLADYTHITVATGCLAAYLFVALGVRTFFGWMRRMVGEKLVASDVFGSWEYYLGMSAGAVRFACMVLVGMALLHAPYISPEQLAAQARMQKENFEDISFPTLGTIQQNVFTGSVSGRLTQRYLVHELIVTTAEDSAKKSSDTIGRQRERAVSEVLGERR